MTRTCDLLVNHGGSNSNCCTKAPLLSGWILYHQNLFATKRCIIIIILLKNKPIRRILTKYQPFSILLYVQHTWQMIRKIQGLKNENEILDFHIKMPRTETKTPWHKTSRKNVNWCVIVWCNNQPGYQASSPKARSVRKLKNQVIRWKKCCLCELWTHHMQRKLSQKVKKI